MFWFSSPPYLRWALAGAVIVVSLAADLRPHTTQTYPVARSEIAPGTVVDESLVTWIELPVGSFPTVELPLTSSRPIASGELIGPWSAAADLVPVPPGWLSVPIPLEGEMLPGARVVLVITGEVAAEIPGLVTAHTPGDGFTGPSTSVAVPPETAGAVANAIRNAELVVFTVE